MRLLRWMPDERIEAYHEWLEWEGQATAVRKRNGMRRETKTRAQVSEEAEGV